MFRFFFAKKNDPMNGIVSLIGDRESGLCLIDVDRDVHRFVIGICGNDELCYERF